MAATLKYTLESLSVIFSDLDHTLLARTYWYHIYGKQPFMYALLSLLTMTCSQNAGHFRRLAGDSQRDSLV